MKVNVVGYLIKEGVKNVFKQKKSSSAALIIMCATMFIFGIFFVLGENISHIMYQIETQQGMQVFIKPETEDDDVKKLRRTNKANGICK